MSQFIQKAKVAKCDETGDVAIIIDGKVHPIGGSAGGEADWNASEGEAGYVKNRTHYIDTEVLDSRSATVKGKTINAVTSAYEIPYTTKTENAIIPEGVRIFAYLGEQRFEITELPSTGGDVKRITFAQIEDDYSLQCLITTTNPLTNRGDRNNCYVKVVDTGTQTLASPNAGSDYIGQKLRIEVVEETIVKLDKMFLPDDIGGGGALIVELTSEDGYIFTPSVARQEVLDAIMAGKNVYLSYPDGWNPFFVSFSKIDRDGNPEWVDIWCGNELDVEIQRYTWYTNNTVELTSVSGKLNAHAAPM